MILIKLFSKPISVIVGLLLIMSVPVTAQDRGAVWVHGLGSDASEWAAWDALFTAERQLATRSRGTFSTDPGVQAMAGAVVSTYAPEARAIYFGHSMGGVVGREIDINHAGTVGGIITAGAPLDGARIANTVHNGEAVNLVVDGIDRVLQGPLRQLGPVTYVIAGWIVDNIVQQLGNTANSMVANFGGQGGADLEENSPYMNSGIRNQQTATYKVHIYGNEDDPGCWRIASTAVNANDDNQFVTITRTAGDVYEAAMWVNYAAAVVTGIFTFVISAGYYVWVADGWSSGMNWWRYDSNRGWHYLIGSDVPGTRTYVYLTFDIDDYRACVDSYLDGMTYDQIPPESLAGCDARATRTIVQTYYSPGNGQSDAFIKAPSQMGYNSDWSSNATRIEARGVNHLEMRNHPVMEGIYRSIFDGGYNVNGNFVTFRR